MKNPNSHEWAGKHKSQLKGAAAPAAADAPRSLRRHLKLSRDLFISIFEFDMILILRNLVEISKSLLLNVPENDEETDNTQHLLRIKWNKNCRVLGSV